MKKTSIFMVFMLIFSIGIALVSFDTEVVNEVEGATVADALWDLTVNGHSRDVYDITTDWGITAACTYEDIVFILDHGVGINVTMGTVTDAATFNNCSFYFNASGDATHLSDVLPERAGFHFYKGYGVFNNCSLLSQAELNTSLTDQPWVFDVNASAPGSGTVNVKMFNTEMKSCWGDDWTWPALDANIMINASSDVNACDFICYYCDFDMPRGFIFGDAADTFPMVNTEWRGNKTFTYDESADLDEDASIKWVNAHMITLHDENTTGIDIDVFDDQDDDLSMSNGTFPSGFGLEAAYFHVPNNETMWFAILNTTETHTGGYAYYGTNPYPYNVSIDTPNTWTPTKNRKITTIGYTAKELALEDYEYTYNQTATTYYKLTEAHEQAFSNRAIESDNMYFTTSDLQLQIGRPVRFSSNDTITTTTGSFSLDLVQIDAGAGADKTVTKGTVVKYNGALNSGENVLTYTWTAVNAYGSTVQTFTTASPTINTSHGRWTAGNYTVSVNLTDDEGAWDTDSMILRINTASTSSGTTRASGDDDAFSWRDDWYRIWTGDWWREVKDSIVDFIDSDTGKIVIAGGLIFLIVEFFTNFSFIKIVKKVIRRK